MSNIDSLISNYKSFDELKIFAEAQFKQLQTLTKKNKDLQDKLDKAIKAVPTLIEVPNLDISKEDAKTIAEIQLFMLKKEAMNRELNTDEAKRVELYNRILKDDAVKSKGDMVNIDKAPTADLLKLVE